MSDQTLTPPAAADNPNNRGLTAAGRALSKPANAEPPEIASASVSDALATLHVNPDTGLMPADVEVRRKEHGYNEVAEKRGHPVLKFLRKFWGISAWMLELIMVLSAVLGKYSDFAMVVSSSFWFRAIRVELLSINCCWLSRSAR